jgi:hypothetical protein
MDSWGHSSFSEKIVLQLVEDGLLCPVMNAAWPKWIVPSNEDEPNPPPVMHQLHALPRMGVWDAYEQLLPQSSPPIRD